jgi:uncharacterized protein
MTKYALITGPSSGIGLELAKLFAADKKNLILVSRSEKKLLELKSEIENKYKVSVEIIAMDLSEQEAAENLHKTLESRNFVINELVNNAGFGDYTEFYCSDYQKMVQMMNLNMLTLVKLTRLLLPAMIERKDGKILNVASVAGFIPGPFMTIYYASKAFVLSFSEGLSVELKNTGVSITVLCPGPTKTAFEENASLGGSDLFKQMPVANALSVAKYGYSAMQQRRAVAVPGLFNKFSIVFMGLLPRVLVRNITGYIQGRNKMK